MVKQEGSLCRARHTDSDDADSVSIKDHMLPYEGRGVGDEVYK